jgi:hypothetical protein
MDKSIKIMSDITVFSKYAKYDRTKKRRETWEELCFRNMEMMLGKYPQLSNEITKVYTDFVIPKKVLPSMRSLQFGGRPIELSNNRIYNCFSADTKFITSLGTKSFSDFFHGDKILVPTHTGEWKEAVVKSYGKQMLQEVEFVRGNTSKKIKTTKNHRWILKSGETTNLSEGDVLIKTPDIFEGGDYESFNPLEKAYWCYGYVFGDGTVLNNSKGDASYSMVRLCGQDSIRYKSRFEEVGFKTSTSNSLAGDFMAYTGSYLKTAPNPEIDDIGLIKAFVRGYLDADGTKNPNWYKNEELSPYTSIQSSEKNHIDFIEKCFEVAGVYISRKEDLTGQETNFGTRGETYRFGISSVIGNNKSSNWSVRSITPLQEEVVWCLEVKDNKSFILSGGIVTGNCAYLPMDHYKAFSETMFLLLGGSGVGYSVQSHHVAQLPEIKKPIRKRKYVVQDSIVGWADSVKALMEAYFRGKSLPVFDFSDIRPKGADLITSGGKAPGPEPLKTCLFQLQKILDRKNDGEKITTLEAHDMMCFIADAVLSGGIRRAALISLFDIDDNDMLTCKFGEWYVENPQRGRANNSAMVIRHKISEEKFQSLWDKIKASGSGEPGFYFSNNTEWGTNPCVSGDTEILTDDGYKRIDSVVDTEVNIWNGFEFSKVTPKITGTNQPMVLVTLSDGRTLNCTEYHNFHIAQGYTGKFDKIKAKDLEVGMKLIKHEFPIIEHGPELKHAYTQGFVAADGMELNRTLHVYPPKYMCIQRLEGVKSLVDEPSNKRKRLILEEVPVSKNFVPLNYNLKSKIEWLSGLFDGDGCELKEGGLQLSSINFKFLSDLQTLLSTVGIQSKVVAGNPARKTMMPDGKGGQKEFDCLPIRRICIGAVQMQQLKKLGLKCERMCFYKEPQRDATQFVTVVDVTENGIEDTVYCFTEPLRNTGIFNGVLTGQCCEIALRNNQFCNLTEINASDITDQSDLDARAKAAAFLGTLQAGYTDFHYLRDIWKRNTEKDALIGVGMTGIASGAVLPLDLTKAAEVVKEENERISKIIGINAAARTTCIKPSGTTSLVVGSSSGIHAWHSEYYIRNIRFGKNEAIYSYLSQNHPELVQDEFFKPEQQSVVGIPVKAPKGSILRTETAIELLERVKLFSSQWIKPGHRKGDNTHNVSATISIGEDEWETVGKWMWDNRIVYNGLSVLPRDNGSYVQAPFEECSKERFEELYNKLSSIDLTKIVEVADNTDLSGEAACAGGVCEIT